MDVVSALLIALSGMVIVFLMAGWPLSYHPRYLQSGPGNPKDTRKNLWKKNCLCLLIPLSLAL